MKAQILTELAKTGMFVAPGSMGDLLADRMVMKIESIRHYKAEGCDRLAEKELAETTFGPKIIDIVKKLAA